MFVTAAGVIARLRVGDRKFSIISNNCWGAHVYQRLRMPYRTPFVGLFLAPECYLRLLSGLRHYLSRPLAFQAHSRHLYDNLPFAHKVCFVSRPYAGLKTAVQIPGSTDGEVPDGQVLSAAAVKYFDAIDLIQGRTGKPSWPSSLRCL